MISHISHLRNEAIIIITWYTIYMYSTIDFYKVIHTLWFPTFHILKLITSVMYNTEITSHSTLHISISWFSTIFLFVLISGRGGLYSYWQIGLKPGTRKNLIYINNLHCTNRQLFWQCQTPTTLAIRPKHHRNGRCISGLRFSNTTCGIRYLK